MTSRIPSESQIAEQLERILGHPSFSRSKRLSELLTAIVRQSQSHLPGSLKEVTLAVTVYGQENYDPRVHSRVRVDATALRTKLAQYYSTDGSSDEVLIEIPRGGYVAGFQLRSADPQPQVLPPWRQWFKPKSASAFAAVIALIGVGLAIRGRNRAAETNLELAQPVRLTFDNRRESSPSFSADGELMAYESDRGKDGYVHLWLESRGGPPRQLTVGNGHDFRPELSPDGSSLAFRSLSHGDGVYIQPISGGSPTLLVRRAYNHRFSPDGRYLAYAAAGEGDQTHIFVIDSEGRAAPRRIDYGAGDAICPIWTPDSRQIVFYAEDEKEDHDYWISGADTSQSPAKRLGIQASLLRSHFPALSTNGDCPQDWIDGSTLLFRVEGKDARDPINAGVNVGQIFRASLSGPGKSLAGDVEPLRPAVRCGSIRVARDKHWLVFNVGRFLNSVWTVNVVGTKPPELARILQDETLQRGTWPSLSGSGNRLCFVLTRYGRPAIVCKDLISGIEKTLEAQPAPHSPVYVDKAGKRVAFLRDGQGKKSVLTLREIESGVERVVGSECPFLFQWSPDDQGLVCAEAGDQPGTRHLFKVAISDGKRTSLLTYHDTNPNPVQQAQVSPDGRWLAVVASTGSNGMLRGSVVPVGRQPSDSSAWITVVEEPFNLSLHWGPDGNTIYFWQIRDGSRCLWGQRLQPGTKRLAGAPFAVLHRHGIQAYPMGGGPLSVGGSAEHLRFATTLTDELCALWRLPFKP